MVQNCTILFFVLFLYKIPGNMYIKCFSSALSGIDAITITIEVNVSSGLQLFIVGLPDSAVKESQQRIMAAFENSGFKMPGRKVTVNMAPANVRKEGSYFDLPIAVAILACTGQIVCENIETYMITGELSLDGSVLPVKGALPMAMCARKEGFGSFILPLGNAPEAAVVKGLSVYGVTSLLQVAMFLNGRYEIAPQQAELPQSAEQLPQEDFMEVKGQESVKRALEVAAAGGHNVLMIGPPGSGKTMLARRIGTIMPPMTLEESLETTKIHSVAGKSIGGGGLITHRPFRAPHHTLSNVALVGGGVSPRPGEISLADNGILFLDELPEFGRSVLEVLRQPLEDRHITISRSQYSVDYPANFMLVASMNPCPCGFLTHPEKECTCKRGEVVRYLNSISGPLLDRIDIHIEVLPVGFEKLAHSRPAESSQEIRNRVCRAREIQSRRFEGSGIHSNAMMPPKLVEQYCKPAEDSLKLLKTAIEKMGLSARAYNRILKVARTIADLEGEEQILSRHIAEAIQYRTLDKNSWIK